MSGPCTRPECGGEVHTDGWGMPIRCPRAPELVEPVATESLVPDLHGWITQQIDHAETAARKAAELCGCHPPALSWTFGDEATGGRILVADEPHPGIKRKIGRRWNGSYEGMFMAEHIVRHDPESVLRRCTADRKILAAHEPVGYACDGCGFDRDEGYYVDHINDCPTLLALAEGYGLTPETLAGLDRPQPPALKPRGPTPDTRRVPPTLRGPNWKGRP